MIQNNGDDPVSNRAFNGFLIEHFMPLRSEVKNIKGTLKILLVMSMATFGGLVTTLALLLSHHME
jgi:hypothetical protein